MAPRGRPAQIVNPGNGGEAPKRRTRRPRTQAKVGAQFGTLKSTVRGGSLNVGAIAKSAAKIVASDVHGQGYVAANTNLPQFEHMLGVSLRAALIEAGL